jgi:hypothetical protein
MSHAGEEFRRVSSCLTNLPATLCSALLANRFSICRPSHTLFSFPPASWHYSFIKQPHLALHCAIDCGEFVLQSLALCVNQRLYRYHGLPTISLFALLPH